MNKRKYYPVIGTKYGEYEVISDIISFAENGKPLFKVRCGCGKIEMRIAYTLESGKSLRCRSCSGKMKAVKRPLPINFQGVGCYSKTHYSTTKNSAIKRNLDFDVSLEYLHELYLKQNKKCALSGIEIVLSRSIKKCSVNWDVVTASLDRIDSSKGYVVGNVQWVHKEVNKLKSTFPVDRLKYWCRLIANNDTLLLQQKEVQ